MDCPPGQNKSGSCREVAVVERWPLEEVRLYEEYLSVIDVTNKVNFVNTRILAQWSQSYFY